MSWNGTGLHPSDPAYDPVLDGVSRGLADLFPPIDNPPRRENAKEDEANPSDQDGEYTDTP